MDKNEQTDATTSTIGQHSNLQRQAQRHTHTHTHTPTSSCCCWGPGWLVSPNICSFGSCYRHSLIPTIHSRHRHPYPHTQIHPHLPFPRRLAASEAGMAMRTTAAVATQRRVMVRIICCCCCCCWLVFGLGFGLHRRSVGWLCVV